MSTEISTTWGLGRFFKCQDKRGIRIDMESVAENTLADHLRKFYAEVKTANGKALTSSSMTGIRAAIHRKLTAPPYNRCMNIMKGTAFIKAVVTSQFSNEHNYLQTHAIVYLYYNLQQQNYAKFVTKHAFRDAH